MNEIKLDQVRIDGGTQPRTAINEAIVAEYAENVEALPALTVFFDGAEYWLADGFHRYHAHRRAGTKRVRISLHKGTQRDAILYSVGANATHGLRRTNEDKRKAVQTLLADAEWAKWPEQKIAECCAVSRDLVRSVKISLVGKTSEPHASVPAPEVPQHIRAKAQNIEKSGGSPRFYDDKHGNVSVMDVSRIGKSRKVQPDDTPPEYAGGDAPDDSELAAIAERERLDRQAFEKLLGSDDALATAHAEIKRLNAELAVVKGQRDQYMNRCNELIRRVKALKRAAA